MFLSQVHSGNETTSKTTRLFEGCRETLFKVFNVCAEAFMYMLTEPLWSWSNSGEGTIVYNVGYLIALTIGRSWSTTLYRTSDMCVLVYMTILSVLLLKNIEIINLGSIWIVLVNFFCFKNYIAGNFISLITLFHCYTFKFLKNWQNIVARYRN